jgi:hypothetical protein
VRRNDDAVGAMSTVHPEDELLQIVAAHDPANIQPVAQRVLNFRCIDIEARNLAPVGFQNLHAELSQQSQPDHRERLTELGLRQAHAVQPDCAERAEAPVLCGYVRRQLARQRHGYHDMFGVIRLAKPCTRNSVSRPERIGHRAGFEHDAR